MDPKAIVATKGENRQEREEVAVRIKDWGPDTVA